VDVIEQAVGGFHVGDFCMRVFRLKKHLPDAPLFLGKEKASDWDAEIFRSAAGSSRVIEGRDRVRKRKISWAPSPSPEVAGYRMYWALNKEVSYNSQFIDINNETSILLPDDVPSFPRISGEIEIGITAVTGSGNESDMCIVRAFVDFTRPDAPSNVKIETVKEGRCW
jgi:hypothetical protein